MRLSWKERDFYYEPFIKIAREMQQWSNHREHSSELWFGEHPIIITKGIRARDEPVPYWPSVATNRGGLLTVHAPGQLVFYPLWDMRLFMSIDQYRWLLEETVIQTLSTVGMQKGLLWRISESPGVFSPLGKIASLGLRVHRYGVYHGISVNVSCALLPFRSIVCCGDPHQKATNLLEYKIFPTMSLMKTLMKKFFYDLIAAEVPDVVYNSSAR